MRLRQITTSAEPSPTSDTPLVDRLNDLNRWQDQLARIDQDLAGLPAAIREAADQRDMDGLQRLYQRQDALGAERTTLVAKRDALTSALVAEAEAASRTSAEVYRSQMAELEAERQDREAAVEAAVASLIAALTNLAQHPLLCREQLGPLDAAHRAIHERYAAVNAGWTPVPASPLTNEVDQERRRAIVEGLEHRLLEAGLIAKQPRPRNIIRLDPNQPGGLIVS